MAVRFVSLAVILLWSIRLQQKFVSDPGLHVPVVSVIDPGLLHVPVVSTVSLAVPVLDSRAAFMRANCRHNPLFSSRHPKSLVFFLLLIAGDVEFSKPWSEGQPDSTDSFEF